MGKLDLPPIFCKQCGYCLYGLPSNRCPECARPFDPTDPRTFRRRPPRRWRRGLLVWGGITLLVLMLGYGGFLTWLYVGWRAEAPARALGQSAALMQSRSLLPDRLRLLLPGRLEAWETRIDHVAVWGQALDAQQIRVLGACRHLRILDLSWPGHVPDAHALGGLAGCSDLEDLQLWVDRELTDEHLRQLSRLRRLKTLRLVGFLSSRWNPDPVAHIQSCGARITAEGLRALKAALPQCRIETEGIPDK